MCLGVFFCINSFILKIYLSENEKQLSYEELQEKLTAMFQLTNIMAELTLIEFKNLVNDIDLVDKRAAQLYLWTERGANRHCKILDTDKAWEQFDNLEETYFNVKKNSINRSQLSESTQALFGLIESVARQELEQKRQAEQLNRIEQKQETIVQTFSKESTKEFRPWVKSCITAIAENLNYFGKSA